MFDPRPLLIIVSVCGAALVVACSSAPSENHAVTEQRIEGTGGACAHALCAAGDALQTTCDPCAAQLCAQDPYCCNTSWDATCVGEVTSICGKSCAPEPVETDAGPSTCAHELCATGAALTSGCAPCTTQLCAQDPYCCAVDWDATCVGEVTSICGLSCN